MNKFSTLMLERINETKEMELPKISTITDETVDLDKWYYNGFYVLLKLKNMMVLVERRIRQRWRHIRMKIIWRK